MQLLRPERDRLYALLGVPKPAPTAPAPAPALAPAPAPARPAGQEKPPA